MLLQAQASKSPFIMAIFCLPLRLHSWWVAAGLSFNNLRPTDGNEVWLTEGGLEPHFMDLTENNALAVWNLLESSRRYSSNCYCPFS